MNHVVLLGRLTKDVEIRYTDSGKVLAQFTLAVNRPGKDADATFLPCVLWGKQAETLGNYVHKGQRILVNGRVDIRSYEKNGQKRYLTEIVCNGFEFIERKGDNQPQEGFSNMGQQVPFNEEIPF